MKRVIAQVVANGKELIVDRPVGGNAVQINGIPYVVESCGDSRNHEVWTEGEKPVPGWVQGYKVTIDGEGLFVVGDKVTIEEAVPEPTSEPVMGNDAPAVEAPAIPPEADTAPSGVESPLDNPEESE